MCSYPASCAMGLSVPAAGGRHERSPTPASPTRHTAPSVPKRTTATSSFFWWNIWPCTLRLMACTEASRNDGAPARGCAMLGPTSKT